MLKSVDGASENKLKAIIFINVQGGKIIVGKYTTEEIYDEHHIVLVDAVEMLSMVNPQGGVMIVGLALGNFSLMTDLTNIAVVDINKKSCYWNPYYGITTGLSVA